LEPNGTTKTILPKPSKKRASSRLTDNNPSPLFSGSHTFLKHLIKKSQSFKLK
jgi:hypothetical protein